MLKKIGLLLIGLAVVFSFVACNKKERNPDTLLVGTNAEFPPFTFRVNDEIQGFDIDIAKEVGKKLNKTIEFKDMPFDSLLPDLILGNIDLIAAGMTFTEERARRVYFTEPHLSNDPLVILTLTKSEFPIEGGLEQLGDKTVVVNEGYTADLYLSSKPNLNLLRLASPADAFLAVKNGRAFAFVTAESTISSFMNTQDLSLFRVNKIEGTQDSYALVIALENTKLQEEVQEALNAMKLDGTLDQIKSKWKLQ